MALARGARTLLPRAARGMLCQQQQQATFLSFLGKRAAKEAFDKGVKAVATVLDGKYMESHFVHPYLNKNAQFVGEDYNGNKYYEITEGVLYGRHRWVVYKDVFDYSPASVPAEWHGWLHNINDDAPTRVKFLEPSYKAPAVSYKYLGYQPKGSYRQKLALGRAKRNWKKYEAWTPPAK
uniref:NADH dehydrogenase [ubiquinone] 1 alpha subcomplex subunit 12 n=1 Tax=Chloropicon laureae TaxID=464258 RepID=A0A7S3E353_9CHLO